MKKGQRLSLITILLVVVILFLAVKLSRKDSTAINTIDHYNTTLTWCAIDGQHSGSMSCWTPATSWQIVTTQSVTNQFVTGNLNTKEELIGKPSFLWWAAKYCAYCREKAPQVEDFILEKFGNTINIQMMTMNIENAPFSTSIPQTWFTAYNYKDFTNESCDIFPMWVVLDKNGKLISKECWGDTTVSQVSEQLDSLIK